MERERRGVKGNGEQGGGEGERELPGKFEMLESNVKERNRQKID